MKYILLLILYGVVFFYPFSLYEKGVSFFSQEPEYFFFSRQESIFNNKDKKNNFLSLFFSENERKKFKELHVCLFQKEILQRNKKILFAEPNRLKRFFDTACIKRSDAIRFATHKMWKNYLYKSFDGKKICKEWNNCATLIEDDSDHMVLGWDRHGVEVFAKTDDEYKSMPVTFDLAQKDENLKEDKLKGFVEIQIPSGGLGNQLFGYWSGVIYALKNNKKPLFYQKSHIEEYLILPYKTSEKVKFNYGAQPEYIKKHVENFVSNGSSHHTINEKGNFIYLNGYSQSWRNFTGYEDYIREHTVFKYPMLAKSKEIAQKMQQENSVSIHVRRGDYVWQGYVLLTQKYYTQAIEYMNANLDNPHFYIFSNDMKWVRENLKIDAPHTFVDWNKKDYQDLELMSFCKNHIIANSTFSWWGAFLSKNKNKIIIAPDKHASWTGDWFNSLLAPDFVTLDVDFYYWDKKKNDFIIKK